MRFHRSLRIVPAIVMLGAALSAGVFIAIAPAARAAIGTAASGVTPPPPSPSPSPIPVNAFLSLDVTAGDANTLITVNGSAFLPNESTSLYWDQPGRVSGASNADANGNFTTKVKPYPGDQPGVHKLCATVPPSPCATFTLQGAAASPSPSPTDSPSPTPDNSPSPTTSATDSPSPTPGAARLNTFDLMTRPPFVILPIIAGLGLVVAIAYWILSIVMRPRQQTLKSVAVAHLATRPDYSAGFGAPPALPAEPAAPPSAWTDVSPPRTAQDPLPAAEAAPSEPAPIHEASPPGFGDAPPPAPDEPPDLPEPGED